jgi:hypothetical protein
LSSLSQLKGSSNGPLKYPQYSNNKREKLAFGEKVNVSGPNENPLGPPIRNKLSPSQTLIRKKKKRVGLWRIIIPSKYPLTTLQMPSSREEKREKEKDPIIPQQLENTKLSPRNKN